MRNVSTNVYAKFRCAPLGIKKALRSFRELITTRKTTTTTRVAFWDPPSRTNCAHGCFQVYFTVTSASTFAGAFTLTAMSADRCVAVCCPVSSRNGCRTLAMARLVILAVWTLAVAAVFPVTIYAQLVPTSRGARSDSLPLCVPLIQSK